MGFIATAPLTLRLALLAQGHSLTNVSSPGRRAMLRSWSEECLMYQLFKVIHIFAVIVFMGNIITGLFWKFHADGTRSQPIIAHTLRGLIRADRWFTIPGVVVITA